ncbi:tagatose 1,6-diphosphate aldolase GatY/KbaY [Scopulibacillus daqui]|uniref:Tagatose 1,6-diphosphate aldolase GatY/KbaY n=1 Tax=Scopulibacillus daqui TaxID=1469162 RepID=A0ABS2PVW1_9BACL|nr:class II fructose-bisphosphate aldolase [Scopulibacillus daqui]MBM7644150.1 tagatose 1,6-diphosphate aldolase GatY/KbaY [Scopulibacillus daqui]
MPLATLNDVLTELKDKPAAIGAFNAHYLDIIPHLIKAAESQQAPLIMQITEATLQNSGIDNVISLSMRLIEKSSIPIVIHYDHGKDIDRVKACIDAGFSSVMYDGSKLPYEENVKRTKEIVAYARPKGVSVEAEIGHVGTVSGEGGDAFYTHPDNASEFARITNVDALAVSIGTQHGLYKDTPKLDIERLKSIHRKVDVPLVLHGASGVPDEDIKKVTAYGICKINIASELKAPWAQAIRDFQKENPDEYDPRKILEPAHKAYVKAVKEKMSLLGWNHAAVNH